MALLKKEERRFAEAISRLAYSNPFLPERIEYEKQALGAEFQEAGAQWNILAGEDRHTPNLDKIIDRANEMVEQLRGALSKDSQADAQELELYEDLVLFHIYHSYRDDLQRLVSEDLESGGKRTKVRFYKDFADSLNRYLEIPGLSLSLDASHLFANLFHVARAFYHIFNNIIGTSNAAARLRASVWQSIFTHNMRRYRRYLYNRLRDITTLVTGPSGTGKELVARAIAFSRHISFDPQSLSFAGGHAGSFYPLNLSALSSTLIESELFGHRRGSFTGALEDHPGWLEVCGPLGSVFLDEIGDVVGTIQVKLLRVLETRTFERLGDTHARHFQGKVIAATNRNLAALMRDGEFREDLYYRLCSDQIITPSLYDQIQESPEELRHLLGYIARRWIGEEVEGIVEEVETWIMENLGRSYRWPGNFRELEQCLSNVLIRKAYYPARSAPGNARELFLENMAKGELSAEELLSQYCTLIYACTGNYEETARRLKIDRRTVKSKIDREMLAALRGDDENHG